MAGELVRSSRPAPSPRYKRVQQQQLVAMLQLHKLGKTQTEIAQVVGCDQKTVSRWLEQFQDTTDHANAYLRGNALRMAQTVVKKGKPDVQLKALQGLGVASQGTEQKGVTIQIGIKDSDVTFACSTE